MKMFRICLLLSLVVLSNAACTIRHLIAEDYPQYLATNANASNLPTTTKANQYALKAATQQHSYEFRAVTTGYANLWVVEFGKMLDDTMKSSDVQKAFGSLSKVSEGSASGSVLLFDLSNYEFKDYGAHVSLNISLSRAGKVVFSKTYTQDGKTQGGKMVFGGAFAQRNAVHQSTKLALDEILRQLIADLNAQAN